MASPADATETTVAQLTLSGDLIFGLGVLLLGFAAWTVGTAGTAVTVRIRRTNTAGTVVKSSGAMTATAGSLNAKTVVGVDTGPTLPGQVYVLTLTVSAATAVSTVSAVELVALVI